MKKDPSIARAIRASDLSLVGGIGLGLGLMYFLDPQKGRRRRALVRDQFIHYKTEAEDFLGRATRDLTHRSQGAVHIVTSKVSQEPVDDDVLIARVRASLGHVYAHPSSLEVQSKGGHVVIFGPVLKEESRKVIDVIGSVPGVKSITDRMDVHETSAHVPGLQGGRERGQENRWMRASKAPGNRLLMGFAGLSLVFYSMRHRGLFGIFSRGLGLHLFGSGLMMGGGPTPETDYRDELSDEEDFAPSGGSHLH